MACRGVHFALSEEQYEKLSRCKSDREVVELIHEEIEENWDEDWLRETDKAWDAIHRSLTGGKLEWENGSFPLRAVVLGGKQLHTGADYIISLATPEQVRAIAEALKSVDKSLLRKGYDQIKQDEYDGEIGDDDFEYTWEWFKDLPSLYEEAAKSGRAVLFSVDQ